MTIAQAVHEVVQKHSLDRRQAKAVFAELMAGGVAPATIAAFLVGLRMKGETIDEIAGAAEAMREVALPVNAPGRPVVDTCGTGGDGKGSFNVSTAAAFVVAGAGFLVAKHGNRSVSSRCGSADLLEELGVRVESSPSEAEEALRETGIAFLFAPRFHPAMKNVMPTRHELGLRTIFNLLGPLTNPARPQVQLIGVYDAALVELVARVLVELGYRHSLVVHGDGHDEITLSGTTDVAEIVDGQIRPQRWSAAEFGLTSHGADALRGGDRRQNAQILRDILQGKEGPLRDAVLVNAAALLRAALQEQGSPALSLPEAFGIAAKSIDSGAAAERLERLQRWSARVNHER